MVGLAELEGRLRGLVEPEEADGDLGGGSVRTDSEDVGGPEGEAGRSCRVTVMVSCKLYVSPSASASFSLFTECVFVVRGWVKGERVRTDESFEAFETVPRRGRVHDVDV